MAVFCPFPQLACHDPREQCIRQICCEYIGFPLGGAFGTVGMPLNGGLGLPPYMGGLPNLGAGLNIPACSDLIPQCLLFHTYCSLPRIAEICMATCGLCGGIGLGIGHAGFVSPNSMRLGVPPPYLGFGK
uniref:Uncharacterized protein n=1 Tax=Ditylenchus dipsaci TaxID=166011 RepID=A0A915CND1_9BILA